MAVTTVPTRATTYTTKQQALIDLFEQHVAAELAGDLDTTMATMTQTPHLHNVPSNVGGYGVAGVHAFYRDHLVGKFFPPDVQMQRVSLTVGDDQLVEEHVISFTHTTEIEWMLPGVAPTGKPVKGWVCGDRGLQGWQSIARAHPLGSSLCLGSDWLAQS